MLERHAHLYEDEEGWGEPFAGLVARVIADYLEQHDPERESAWVAELDGRRAGAVYCVRNSDEVAQLRLLFVDSEARGRGIGSKLVQRCIAFARDQGYRRMVLWTNSSLAGARRIYDAAGFEQTLNRRRRSPIPFSRRAPWAKSSGWTQELWLDLSVPPRWARWPDRKRL